MGLPRAIQAHSEGNLALAATHYRRAFEQKQYKPELFQNYGALLRGNGDLDKAKIIYLQGLKIYPGQLGILRNYANLLRERGEVAESLCCSLKALQIAWLKSDDVLETTYCELINLLLEHKSLQWALALVRQAFAELGVTTKLLWTLFRLSSHDGSAAFDIKQSQFILELIEENLSDLKTLDRAEFLFSKAFYFAKRQKTAEAVDAIREAHYILKAENFSSQEECDSAQKLINMNSWNASCVLLKAPRFETAWKLFEYGLRAPAVGRQRWQRHLRKVFTHCELSLWRGDSLSTKRLLLLEEQAVGDTMMFLTLLPTLVDHSKHIGIVLSDRLLPIYQRSCKDWVRNGQVSVWGHGDAASGRLLPNNFDYQSPVGSVCQYLFNRIEDFSPKAPVLIADENRSSEYREKKPIFGARPLRIGISWRGGGRSDRIKLKSIDAKMFAGLMEAHSKDASFVNLQYGDVSAVVANWLADGLPVVQESSVDPLKNMDEWLNLVASCDAVISVANTTIHGAGGLNIPTLCLLSQHSDWRWLNDPLVKRSYWYPSVGIARESVQDGWSLALQQASQWISEGCPMPDGPVYTEPSGLQVEHASVVSVGGDA